MLPKILTRPEISYPLVTFCAFSILYLVFYDWVLLHGLWFTTVLKCLPIFCLCWLVSVDSHIRSKEQKFKNKIFYGLLYSSLGDALLMWDYFKLGMIAFAIAHIFYISAFGFTSLKIEYGFVLYTLCIIILYMLVHGLEGVLLYAVPIYSFILVTMVWRSLVFTHNLKKDFMWMKNVVRVSSVLWMLSDGLLGVNKFLFPVPFSQFLIMFTYYFGQLGIALCTLTKVKLP